MDGVESPFSREKCAIMCSKINQSVKTPWRDIGLVSPCPLRIIGSWRNFLRRQLWSNLSNVLDVTSIVIYRTSIVIYSETSIKRTPSIKGTLSRVPKLTSYRIIVIHDQSSPKVFRKVQHSFLIASLATWNFITVQSNRWMLIVNKHCAFFTNLYQADTWESREGVRLIEVSL